MQRTDRMGEEGNTESEGEIQASITATNTRSESSDGSMVAQCPTSPRLLSDTVPSEDNSIASKPTHKTQCCSLEFCVKLAAHIVLIMAIVNLSVCPWRSLMLATATICMVIGVVWKQPIAILLCGIIVVTQVFWYKFAIDGECWEGEVGYASIIGALYFLFMMARYAQTMRHGK